MSSDGECKLKAGHPPAVKAGKMRITQHKPSHESSSSSAPEENILKVPSDPPKANSVSGAPVHGHSDYSAEAVQKFHEKPLPTRDSKGVSCIKPNIQQPRK